MDLQKNWFKFKKFFSAIPAEKRGITVLTFHDKVIHGSVSMSVPDLGQERLHGFNDRGLAVADLDSTYDLITQRYQARGFTAIRRDGLMKSLLEMPLVELGQEDEKLYFTQLEYIRKSLGLDGGKKKQWVDFRGERSATQYLPRTHFILDIFHSWVADLLPERKLLLVGICDEDELHFEALLLEYQGRELARVHDPEWGNFDWRSLVKGFVRRGGAERFVGWCESKFALPAYAIFITRAAWKECTRLQIHAGNRSAWKHFLHKMSGGELSQEVLVEPSPAPLRAIFYWNAYRPRF